jgi:hypothetical protein
MPILALGNGAGALYSPPAQASLFWFHLPDCAAGRLV